MSPDQSVQSFKPRGYRSRFSVIKMNLTTAFTRAQVSSP